MSPQDLPSLPATREDSERRERVTLSPLACFSDASAARAFEEAPDPLRTGFTRDRDRIVHAGAFRRLKDKTQVFVIDEGDFYRTRLTHTLESAQLARLLGLALRPLSSRRSSSAQLRGGLRHPRAAVPRA
jgi:dGTPase